MIVLITQTEAAISARRISRAISMLPPIPTREMETFSPKIMAGRNGSDFFFHDPLSTTNLTGEEFLFTLHYLSAEDIAFILLASERISQPTLATVAANAVAAKLGDPNPENIVQKSAEIDPILAATARQDLETAKQVAVTLEFSLINPQQTINPHPGFSTFPWSFEGIKTREAALFLLSNFPSKFLKTIGQGLFQERIPTSSETTLMAFLVDHATHFRQLSGVGNYGASVFANQLNSHQQEVLKYMLYFSGSPTHQAYLDRLVTRLYWHKLSLERGAQVFPAPPFFPGANYAA